MHVELKEGESFDQVLKRFVRGVSQSGILRSYRESSRFVSKSETERLKRRRAARRKARKG
ncbi:MAG: 30S ribosomal protein S21 [Chloroflexi bacterium]|nr:30S ribosomal protein S21 [Chloroflexota bacterium]